MASGDNEDSEHLRQEAKKKRLGNVRFIAELARLDLLNEAILHKCIKNLLDKRKTEKYSDMSNDLECLCKMMPSIGLKLDQGEAIKLMDQYFDRIKKLQSIKEIPSRIRFMLQDLIELRENKWVPRQVQLDLAPKTMKELRSTANGGASSTPLNNNLLTNGSAYLNGGSGFNEFSYLNGGYAAMMQQHMMMNNHHPWMMPPIPPPPPPPHLPSSQLFYMRVPPPSLVNNQTLNGFDYASYAYSNRFPLPFQQQQQQQQQQTQSQQPIVKTSSNSSVLSNNSQKDSATTTTTLNDTSSQQKRDKLNSSSSSSSSSSSNHNNNNSNNNNSNNQNMKINNTNKKQTKSNNSGDSDSSLNTSFESSNQLHNSNGHHNPINLDTLNDALNDLSHQEARKSPALQQLQHQMGPPSMIGGPSYIPRMPAPPGHHYPPLPPPYAQLPPHLLARMPMMPPQSTALLPPPPPHILAAMQKQGLTDREEMDIKPSVDSLTTATTTINKKVNQKPSSTTTINNSQQQQQQFNPPQVPTPPPPASSPLLQQQQQQPVNSTSSTNGTSSKQQQINNQSQYNQHNNNNNNNNHHYHHPPPSHHYNNHQQQHFNVNNNNNNNSTNILNNKNNGVILTPATEILPLNKPIVPLEKLIQQNGDAKKHNKHQKSSKEHNQLQSKQELHKKVDTLLNEYLEDKSDAATCVKTIKTYKFNHDQLSEMIRYMVVQTLSKQDQDRLNVSKLFIELHQASLLPYDVFMNGFNMILENLTELESTYHFVKSNISLYVSRAICDALIQLNDLAQMLKHGAYYPLFFLCLQNIHKIKSQEWLRQQLEKSKVNLIDMLSSVDRSKERLIQILEDRELGFLCPMLKIESILYEKIYNSIDCDELNEWIKSNVNKDLLTTVDFIQSLVTCIVKNAAEKTLLADGKEANSKHDKLSDKQKALIQQYKPILQQYLNSNINKQVEAIYAMQIYAELKGFPKNFLPILFHQMYDLEIIEEEAFYQWKDELNDSYPNKGQALFHLQKWFNWLQEASEESDTN